MGSVTMKDVATRLGVSVTSVSNAFSRPDRISADLRSRIIDGAADLGYHGPDAAGRVLRSGRANAFGVVFNDRLSYVFTDPYAIALLAGFTEVLEEAGVGVFLAPLPVGPQGSEADPGAIATAVVDGVVGLCAGPSHPGIVAATRRQLPVVLTDTSPDHDYVSIDDRAAGRLVGRHLAGLGHRVVGLVCDTPDGDEVRVLHRADLPAEIESFRRRGWADASNRLEGIVESVADRDVVAVTAGRNTRDSGRRAAAALLDRDPRPTAVVAVSDVLGLGVLDEVRSRGLVPGVDVSVTGFDGIPEAVAAGLTTVVQPIAEKGRQAARLLLDPTSDRRQVVLPTELRVGTTTGPAPR
ncbi:LacI family DNA-binding transcriptional regulator [Auraticoccus monumenti]|uniref:DNA-binding transcriptional regulator, LacI/PurR family n=1 Tax=Auraticoccus monumenti TaxID=675864 RepID=A0A1G6WZ06_9ACTN|nr:LacI family DNA-binding transcriptional regulator [Auraticoccus monumenti]SDD70235.1 DNA-binding transcriptional regulator, LacI/PurR family [Auraticoccus monumenti]